MIKNFATIIAVFAASLLWVGCDKSFDIEENRQGRLLVRLAFDDFKDVELRSPGTPDESLVSTIDVIFFNAAGEKIKMPGQQGFSVFYDVVNDDVDKWKDKDKNSKTVVLPVTAENVINKTIIVVANLPATIKNKLETNEIITADQLKAAFSQQEAIDDLGVPLLMIAEKKITVTDIPDTEQENTIQVQLERTVAKVDIILHYEWNKLVPNNEFVRGNYTMKDFSGKTFLVYPTALKNIEKRIHRPKTTLEKTVLGAPQATSKITAYVNEYNLEDPYTTVTAPYVMFELPAILGKEFAGSIGIFPPPAGGEEEFNHTPITNHYRLVMPRKIQRNHHYTIHAVVFGVGAPTAEGAQLLTFQVTVVPWEK